jgi:hypothetical protein
MSKSKEQKLIDVCFELVLVSTSSPEFCSKTNDEKAEWVRRQLNLCGFAVMPSGCSHGVLIKDDSTTTTGRTA